MISLSSPTVAQLGDLPASKLEKRLAYLDKRVDFELKKSSASLRKLTGRAADSIRESMGDERYEATVAALSARVAELRAERKKSLLFKTDGAPWTYSGLAHSLAAEYGHEVVRGYPLPCLRQPGAWAETPKHPLRPYQEEAVEKLLAAASTGPAGVELATGAGKSRVIMELVQRLGLRALVMAPSTSIARQLFDDFSRHLGSSVVGLYGDGVKDYKKRVVVAIDDSLTKVTEGSAIWNELSHRDVFVADESHLAPANTLAKVCFGLASRAAYRFFFSATQMRGDGLDLVLEGIVGQIVMTRSVADLVAEGYLAKPVFKMVTVRPNSDFVSFDQNKMTRRHLYYNPRVNRLAADLANKFVSQAKRPVVILVEELEQFKKLLPHLEHVAKFAHAPLTQVGRENVPEPYWNDKPKDLVASFNRGEYPILVGTSCISTGTDIQVAEAVIYLQGGISEVKVRQAVGRGTRGGPKGTVFNPMTGRQKLNCVHVDVDVWDRQLGSPDFTTHRHAERRAEIYEEIGGPVARLDYSER